ncbi:hypothetical protein QR680_018605 [Steinernema hermaphroditum]|uniref:Uncharacterized protein n=1 Tax=Steinernema hermaphroditum TaxID=289476 RepID=A0AA39HIG8_9BILA|nr:hypothetical protein QR680_018605 [Steinernema hermaphroditum]
MVAKSSKLTTQLLAYLAWKNFGSQPIEVAIMYPFIESLFPGFAAERTQDAVRKSIRTSLNNYFYGTVENTAVGNPQKWTVKVQKLKGLEEEARRCLPGEVLHSQVIATMDNPELLSSIVDGSWGPRGSDGAALHTSKKAQEEAKKALKRRSSEEAPRKPKKARKTASTGGFIPAPAYHPLMVYPSGYPNVFLYPQQYYQMPTVSQPFWNYEVQTPYHTGEAPMPPQNPRPQKEKVLEEKSLEQQMLEDIESDDDEEDSVQPLEDSASGSSQKVVSDEDLLAKMLEDVESDDDEEDSVQPLEDSASGSSQKVVSDEDLLAKMLEDVESDDEQEEEGKSLLAQMLEDIESDGEEEETPEEDALLTQMLNDIESDDDEEEPLFEDASWLTVSHVAVQ